MIVLEIKLRGKREQFHRIDEAIRTAQFIRNKCIRLWRDNKGINKTKMFRHNTELRATYPWCHNLNSHACQASVERAAKSIDKFYGDLQDPSLHLFIRKVTPDLRSILAQSSTSNLVGKFLRTERG